MTTVVTGFSPTGRIEYGERFLKTFEQFWPQSVGLRVFVEESTSIPRKGERSLWSCPGLQSFIGRHRNDLRYTGMKPVSTWRPKDYDKGYSYRHDAVKFCRQCFIPEAAASEFEDGEILVWLDGDVVTHTPVPEGFVESLIDGMDICYLGRINFHTELGFWAIRLSPRTRKFLADFAELWRSDMIFELREWHSAFAFDHMLVLSDLKIRNLTPNGRGTVWMQSPLYKYTDHLKGRRKYV